MLLLSMLNCVETSKTLRIVQLSMGFEGKYEKH